jgi:hypothetical protein
MLSCSTRFVRGVLFEAPGYFETRFDFSGVARSSFAETRRGDSRAQEQMHAFLSHAVQLHA